MNKEKVIKDLQKEILDGKFVEIMGNVEEALRRLSSNHFTCNKDCLESQELNYQANEIKALVLHMSQRTVWTVLKMYCS